MKLINGKTDNDSNGIRKKVYQTSNAKNILNKAINGFKGVLAQVKAAFTIPLFANAVA